MTRDWTSTRVACIGRNGKNQPDIVKEKLTWTWQFSNLRQEGQLVVYGYPKVVCSDWWWDKPCDCPVESLYQADVGSPPCHLTWPPCIKEGNISKLCHRMTHEDGQECLVADCVEHCWKVKENKDNLVKLVTWSLSVMATRAILKPDWLESWKLF